MGNKKCSVRDGKFVEPSRTFFSVKSGEYAKKGIALNFCPFCGVQIDSPFIEKPNPPINKWIDWHYTKENPFPKLEGDPLVHVKFKDETTSIDTAARPLSYWHNDGNGSNFEHSSSVKEDCQIIAYMILDPKDHD